MPSVQETESRLPVTSKETCFTPRDCSRRCITRVMSRVLTTLTSSSSLATATHSPSRDSARSRTGREQRTRISSSEFVSKEYLLTEPSSAPTTKKSFVATTAV